MQPILLIFLIFSLQFLPVVNALIVDAKYEPNPLLIGEAGTPYCPILGIAFGKSFNN